MMSIYQPVRKIFYLQILVTRARVMGKNAIRTHLIIKVSYITYFLKLGSPDISTHFFSPLPAAKYWALPASPSSDFRQAASAQQVASWWQENGCLRDD